MNDEQATNEGGTADHSRTTGVTELLPMSDFHVIRSLGVEDRGEEIVLPATGELPETIRGVREMVLTINGDFPANIDIVEVNGVRFARENE